MARGCWAVGVGAREIAKTEGLPPPADHADAVRRKVSAEHVTASRDERRAVEREFVVGKCRQTRRIPERRFASPLRGRCGLSHPDGLRADRKNQEQRTGVEGLLSGKLDGWNVGKDNHSNRPTFQRSSRKASPHR